MGIEVEELHVVIELTGHFPLSTAHSKTGHFESDKAWPAERRSARGYPAAMPGGRFQNIRIHV